MAKYWEHLEYHEDTVEKHMITKEELAFLIDLQKEMNTQDTCGNADPRYWTIGDYKKEYSREDYEDCDGFSIYEDGNELLEATLKGGSETTCVKNVAEELREYYEIVDLEDDINEITYIDDLREWCEDNQLDIVFYKYVPAYEGIFLTQKGAEEHLRKCSYRYHADAHTYAMTAFRDPAIKKLYKIIQETDWSNMLKMMEE